MQLRDAQRAYILHTLRQLRSDWPRVVSSLISSTDTQDEIAEMKIAIEGCCHGALPAIYSHIAALEARHRYKVDLLLICGDFQAIRNERDLQCMAVPDKYKQLGDFWKYYTGVEKAPIPTIVIGGNHEASNYLWELYHGGWLAPNIYFLGHAGCIQVNGIRIAGASGIFKSQDFPHGHWERLPYNQGSMRSIYHIREFNIMRLSLLSRPTIFLSHDWPQGIEHFGDTNGLLRRKPFFRQDIKTGSLGSPPMMGLLHTLKPDWWFSAHLHCRFDAAVIHQEAVPQTSASGDTGEGTNPDEIVIGDFDDDTVDAPIAGGSSVVDERGAPPRSGPSSSAVPVSRTPPEVDLPTPAPLFVPIRNDDEIILDDEELEVSQPPAPLPKPLETKFLALDKCLPKRQFLEVVDVPIPADFIPPDSSAASVPGQSSAANSDNTVTLSFDPEWLAITRAFQPFLSMTRTNAPYPDEAQAREAVSRELEWVQKNVIQKAGDARAEETSQSRAFVPSKTANNLL
ncbi:hypothetical protein NLI96_g12748 [Meripilus lineatus]|uniref:Lariat debranching enzyme C-terminal domain-containing protein n=1 Tax=Meripilus lineatus TaxID=2056292 RepID=A0AAD5UPC3_9APHY|nr:hypothetical protein NLI96_g12748 [Physisporinus lineatus]